MSNPSVTMEFEGGGIRIDVAIDRAPRVANYFLDLVERGVYDGSLFYRSTTLGVTGGPRLVQAGPLVRVFAADVDSVGRHPGRIDLLESFETTAQSGLLHEAGTVSLARDLVDTGHALPELFICLGAFAQLDFGGRAEPDGRGFPAFAHVSAGLDLVAALSEGATGGRSRVARLEGEILSNPVRIRRAVIEDEAAEVAQHARRSKH